MTAREDCLEAGARALDANWGDAVWAILDAVEPIIRADEAARHHDGGDCDCTSFWRLISDREDEREAEVRERMRAQVEALPFTFMGRGPQVLRSDVLGLLGGDS